MASTIILDPAGHTLSESNEAAVLSERKQMIDRLSAPFPIEFVRWKVTEEMTVDGQRKGKILPYLRASEYMDRLDEVVGVGMWSKSYVHSTIEGITVSDRNGNLKTRAKVTLTCNLEIVGLGRNSGTGECWADDPNAMTSADAQALKRAAGCFGIGRYLKKIRPVWVQLDSYGRPAEIPALPDFALPRPAAAAPPRAPAAQSPAGPPAISAAQQAALEAKALSISRMEEKKERCLKELGRDLYTDVVKQARATVKPASSSQATAQHIEQCLDDACHLLHKTRQFAAEVDLDYLNQTLDRSQVVQLDCFPSLAALNAVYAALEARQEQAELISA